MDMHIKSTSISEILRKMCNPVVCLLYIRIKLADIHIRHIRCRRLISTSIALTIVNTELGCSGAAFKQYMIFVSKQMHNLLNLESLPLKSNASNSISILGAGFSVCGGDLYKSK